MWKKVLVFSVNPEILKFCSTVNCRCFLYKNIYFLYKYFHIQLVFSDFSGLVFSVLSWKYDWNEKQLSSEEQDWQRLRSITIWDQFYLDIFKWWELSPTTLHLVFRNTDSSCSMQCVSFYVHGIKILKNQINRNLSELHYKVYKCVYSTRQWSSLHANWTRKRRAHISSPKSQKWCVFVLLRVLVFLIRNRANFLFVINIHNSRFI